MLAAFVVWVAAYADSLGNSFHFDDDHVIQRNVYIRSLKNIPLFFTDAKTFSTFASNANYRPMESVTLAIDYAIAGLQPAMFHVTQLLLFLLVGVLFFLVIRAILAEDGPAPWHRWAALFGTAFFCLHTGNTEPGNYICARSEEICAAGVLGAFLVYIRFPRARPLHLFLIPMILGAMAKTPAVIFGPLLLIYKLLYEAELTGKALRSGAGWKRLGRAFLTSVPSLAASVLTFKFVEGMNPPGQNYGGSDRIQYLWTQAFVWLRYLKLFILPTGLSADSDMTLLPTWKDPRVLAGVAALVITLVIALWAAFQRRYRPVTLGIVWFWAGIAPTSTVFPLAEVTNDHRMFLGWLGLTLAAVTVIFEAGQAFLARARNPGQARLVLTGAAVALLLAHAVGTALRNLDWRDEEALWTDAIVKSPGNGRAWMNYGLTKMSRGDYPESKRAFDKAATLVPYYSILAVNRAILASAMKDPASAEALFRSSLTMIPKSGAGPFFYGRFLLDQGRAPEAIPLLEESARLDYGDFKAGHLLLDLAAARGDKAELMKIADGMLAIGFDAEAKIYRDGKLPISAAGDTSDAWFKAGLADTNHSDHLHAAIAYQEAVRIDPKNADAWNNLGWSLQSLGFISECIPAYKQASALRPSDDRARNNLADAYRRLAAASHPLSTASHL